WGVGFPVAAVAFAAGVARGAREGEGDRRRRDRLGRDVRRADVGPARGADEAGLAPALDEEGDRVAALARELRGVLDEERQRDLEGVDPGAAGDLHLEGLEDLGE